MRMELGHLNMISCNDAELISIAAEPIRVTVRVTSDKRSERSDSEEMVSCVSYFVDRA